MIISKDEISDLIFSLKEDQAAFKSFLLEFIDGIQVKADASGDEKMKAFVDGQKKKLLAWTEEQIDNRKQLHHDLKAEFEKLIREIETFDTHNYLLEYKQKDLMLLANELEEANEKLEEQKQHIEKQAEELEKSHQAILEKNDELQSQNDYILDQSDYLHEANERISEMNDYLQKQQEEILQKNNELIALNKEKNNLIGVVAHDLKSPLNQIKGLLTIIKLKPDSLDSETMGYVEIIEKSATRLTDMINKILDVEAIESKKLNIQLEDIDVKALLQEIADNYKLAADKKQIQIHVDLKGENAIASLDKNFSMQVFENLISNAIKFSPHQKNIYIIMYTAEGHIISEIKDEGPGLSDQDKKLLFSKYQKLSARPTGDEVSTGLGLSIVKKFTEGMGGKIWYESELGQGTSFFVSFPSK